MAKRFQQNFRLLETGIDLLEQLCELHDRTGGEMIDFMIKQQAKKDNIKARPGYVYVPKTRKKDQEDS